MMNPETPGSTDPPPDIADLATQLSTPLAEGAGTIIGPYKLLEQLGEGGFGVVWAAEQREPVKRRVALKIIKVGMDTKQVVARFEAERQALAMMDHPNIAKVLGGGSTDSGRPYFCMELVKGIPITQYCDENKLSTQARLELLIKVCHGIQHAHQKGVIHRDIKPSNILVSIYDDEAIPKVIDFGIAKATQQELTEKTIYTQLQQFIGTPAYMSPEQAVMSGQDIDTRSDVYSLGVLLYELLTGRTPFDAKQLMKSGLDEMRKIIREKEPPRPSTKISELTARERTATAQRRGSGPPEFIRVLRGDLDWIVMKALEKDRARRYETANGLAADIERHLNNEPIVARPPSAAYRFQKAWRRNKLIYASGGAVVFALITGITLASLQAIRARRAEAEQTRLRMLAEQNEGEARRAQSNERRLRQLSEQTTEQLRQSVYAADMNVAHHALEEGNRGRVVELLNKHIPEDNQPDLRGFEWRYLWALSRGDAKEILQPHASAVTGVAYSPNGKILVTSSFDRTIKIWKSSLDGQLNGVQTLDGFGKRNSVAFSDTGDLLYVDLHRNLILKDLDSGEMRKNFGRVLNYNDTTPVVFLRGNQWVAGKTLEGVALWHINSNEQRTIPDRRRAFGSLLAATDNEHHIAISDGRKIQLWNTDPVAPLATLSDHDSLLIGLVSSPDGTILAAGRRNGTVELIAVKERRILHVWKAHSSLVFALTFSPDGKILATGGADQLIHLWDVAALSKSPMALEPLRTLGGHENQVWALRFSPDGLLASGSKDGRVALWDAQLEETIPTSRKSSIQFAALRPGKLFGARSGQALHSFDGQIVASAEGDYSEVTVELIDANSDEVLFRLTGHKINIASMAFSPSDQLLATGGHDNVIRLWDTSIGKERFVLRGHFSSVSALVFSPGERTLASGSTDGTVKLWSVATGQEMISRRFSAGTVADLKFSQDSRVLGVQFRSEAPSVSYIQAPSIEEVK